MITYRDMTFCINTECKNRCKRFLTPEIKQAAQRYGLPVACSEFICLDKGEDGKWRLDIDEA